MGINTVMELARANPQLIRKQFSIVMQRTVLELNGTACIEIEHTPDSKKQIVASRSFGQKVTELDDLKEAVSRFAQDAVMRLRGEGQLCGCLMVFCRSNPFDPNKSFYSNSLTYAFEEPTDNALLVVKMATLMMQHLYKQGIEFKKCGVSLTALSPKANHIFDLLTDHVAIEKQEKLMQAIETVQDKYGKKKLAIGSSMLPNRTWSMSRANVSQNYFQVGGLLKVN